MASRHESSPDRELAADYLQGTMTCSPPRLSMDSSDPEEAVSSEESYGAA